MKVLVRGGYGLNNFGDDALMITMYDHMKDILKEDEFGFYCTRADYFNDLLPAAKIISSDDLFSKLDVEMLVYGGGTQFFSFPNTQVKYLPKMTLKKLKYFFDYKTLKSVILPRLRGFKKVSGIKAAKTVAIGIGVGPFVKDSVEEKVAMQTFQQLDQALVRDVVSYDMCKSWDSKGLFLGSDLCFNSSFVNNYFTKTTPSADPKIIGIIVRDWKHTDEGHAYYGKLLEATRIWQQKGYQVKYILFSEERDPEWLEIIRRESIEAMIWDARKYTFKAFIQQLAAIDIFVTARFHGAIFAALLNKPTVCIEVEQKLRIVSDNFKAFDCWKFPFDVAELVNDVEQIRKDYVKRTALFQADLDREIARGDKMFSLFRQSIQEL
jgi:polysaccharide pyruvyl transferase WcaK-like protein